MYLASIFYSLVIVCLTIVLWRRRKYYYLSYKLPGPLAFPFIGNFYMFVFSKYTNLTYCLSVMKRYPKRFRLWLGPLLLVVDSAPDDLEIIFNKCFDKSLIYAPAKVLLGEGLATSPADKWKKHRKLINRSFNLPLIENSFTHFQERSRDFAEEIGTWSAETQNDVFPNIFEFTFKAALENLCGFDPSLVTNVDYFLKHLAGAQQTGIECLYDPVAIISLLFKRKLWSKKFDQHAAALQSYMTNLINIKLSKMENFDEFSLKSKFFLNQLIILNKQNILSDQDLMDEFNTMITLGSETVALSVSLVLLVLGIYPEYQNKVLDELNQIFGETNRKSTLEDIKKMNYLELVVKEALRLFCILPVMTRETMFEITLADGTTLPPSTTIAIPVFRIHTDPQIWKDPLKFDPDRFLPEEFKKIPKNAYLPFGLGPRNCIGRAQAMLEIKTLVSEIVRKYQITADQYKSIDDIEFCFQVVMKPSKGFPMRFEKRH